MAITGNWSPPNKGIQSWAVDWMHGFRGSSPRYCLAQQMRYIRRAHGAHHSREFRNYLLWLGVYPSRKK